MRDYESTNIEAAARLAREADPSDWPDRPFTAAELALEEQEARALGAERRAEELHRAAAEEAEADAWFEWLERHE